MNMSDLAAATHSEKQLVAQSVLHCTYPFLSDHFATQRRTDEGGTFSSEGSENRGVLS